MPTWLCWRPWPWSGSQSASLFKFLSLRLRAKKEFVDNGGVERVNGDEWLVCEVGSYLPGPYEEVVKHEKAHILTDAVSLFCQFTASTFLYWKSRFY